VRAPWVILDDVLVVRRTDSGWFCDVPKHPRVRFIAVMQVAPATSVPSEGRRGPIAVTPSAASELGIAPVQRTVESARRTLS